MPHKIELGQGQNVWPPFYYFAYGAAVSEVIIDLLTGENRLVRADLLHDVGKSQTRQLMGQIEGGFIRVGMVDHEELVEMKMSSNNDTPVDLYDLTCADRLLDWRVGFYAEGENSEDDYKRQAVGESPLMLAISAWFMLSDALSGINGDKIDGATYPGLDAPATERDFAMCKPAWGSFCLRVDPLWFGNSWLERSV